MRETYFLKTLLKVIIFAIVNACSNTAFAKIPDTSITLSGVESMHPAVSQAIENNHNVVSFNTNNLAINQNTDPTLAITEITTPDLTANIGNSDSQTFNISGLSLSEDVIMTISGTNADQFNLSQSSVTQTDSIAPNTTITLTYSPTTTGIHSATLTCSSTRATDITLPLSGISGLDNPIAISASGISESGFNANWNTVPGATEYLVDVYYKPDNPLVQNIEGFNSGTTAPLEWFFTGIDATYTSSGLYGTAPPSLRFDATGDVIITPILPNAATEMKFWLKGLSATGSSLLIEGYNGSAWIQIDNIVTPSNTAQIYLYDATSTPALPANITQFRYVYTKVSNNIAFDDVSITYTGATSTTIEGSPFTVIGSTNKKLTGLHDATNYYYRVIAKNTTTKTTASNEIHVSTLTTDIAKTYTGLNIMASNGIIKLTATAGETVEVYNSIGQKILQQIALKGVNTIHLTAHGLLIVKVGNHTAKVIL